MKSDVAFLAIIWVGSFISLVCFAFALLLWTKRVSRRETEMNLRFVGTIRTSSSAVVLFALGLFLFVASTLEYRQMRRDITLSSAVTLSTDVVMRLISPEVLGDANFRSYVKTLPEPEREAFLIKAARLARSEFHSATGRKFSDFSPGDLSQVASVSGSIADIDPESNGHALYYQGEYWRLLDDQDRMREYFNLYLSYEHEHHSSFLDRVTAEQCYETAKGYCRERTEWIDHLMANSFYKQALGEPDLARKRSLLQTAQSHAAEVLQSRPAGFDSTRTAMATAALQSAVARELSATERDQRPR